MYKTFSRKSMNAKNTGSDRDLFISTLQMYSNFHIRQEVREIIQFLNRFKPMALLEDMAVNYTGSGTYATYG